MSKSLEVAIARLVADAKANDHVLKVAPAAQRLAHEYAGDARMIAQMITDYGIYAHINMEMTSPEEESGDGPPDSGASKEGRESHA